MTLIGDMTDWHPEDIKAAIRKRGSTLAELARAEGISKQVLSMVLQGRASARDEKAIAKFLSLKPATIWPSRYLPNGERIRFTRAAPATRRKAA